MGIEGILRTLLDFLVSLVSLIVNFFIAALQLFLSFFQNLVNLVS